MSGPLAIALGISLLVVIQTGAPAQLSAVDAVLDKVPFRILESNDEVTITTEFNEVRHNVDIDREKFVKPGR